VEAQMSREGRQVR